MLNSQMAGTKSKVPFADISNSKASRGLSVERCYFGFHRRKGHGNGVSRVVISSAEMLLFLQSKCNKRWATEYIFHGYIRSNSARLFYETSFRMLDDGHQCFTWKQRILNIC